MPHTRPPPPLAPATAQTSPASPQPDAALAMYRWRASFYDQQLAPYEPIRRQAVTQLALQPGQTVLDMGCGTGMSLGLLQATVGPGGRVIGVDQCPEMVDVARQRIAQHGWTNVELVCAPIEQATLPAQADAAFFHFTHDILQTPAAVDHVLQHLKPGATIVATGLQWTAPWLGPLNTLVWMAALHSVTTLTGLARPWQALADRGVDMSVDTAIMGTIYVAHGTRPAKLMP